MFVKNIQYLDTQESSNPFLVWQDPSMNDRVMVLDIIKL